MIKKPPPLVVRKSMHCACRSGAVNNLLAHGSTYQEILSEYEGVTIDEICACILFATKALEESVFLPLNASVV